MKEIEQIEGYLNNQLSSEERSVFQKQLGKDKDLQAKVEDYRILFRGFRGLRQETFETKLRTWNQENPLDKDESEPLPSPSISAKVFTIRRLVAAASVLFLLGTAWWLTMDQSSAFEKFVSQQEVLIAMDLGIEKNVEEEVVQQLLILKTAQTAYQQKQYQESKALAADISAESLYYSQAQYVRAYAAIQLKEYPVAIAAFENIMEKTEPEQFKNKEEIQWSYLLCLSRVYLKQPTAEHKNKLTTNIKTFKHTANPKNIYLEKVINLEKVLLSE